MDYIGFDLGTSTLKAVRWNPEKGVTGQLSRLSPLLYPAPGKIEIDAETYLSIAGEMLEELASLPGDEIDAVSWASAAGNTVLCDDAGTPLTPVISWLDTRLEWLPPEFWQVHNIIGWTRIPTFPLMHLEYFRRNSPALLGRCQITMLNELLSWRWTGKRALDFSSGTPFYLIDQQNRTYYQPYLRYYGIEEKQLPPLVDTGDMIGTLKQEFVSGSLTSATRIIAGSFDHPAGARSAGIKNPDELLLSCGTSWVGFHPVIDRREVEDDELCDPFHSARGGCWGAMFAISKIGVFLEDFIVSRYGKDRDRYDKFNEDAMCRNTEAAALMHKVIKDFHNKLAGRKFSRVVMIGGPSEGAAWRQYLGAEFGFDIDISPYKNHSGAVGAAMTAAGKEL